MFCVETANLATNLPLTGKKMLKPHLPKLEKPLIYKGFFGRGDWIRTSALCVPNAALYQAEPHPESDYYTRFQRIFQDWAHILPVEPRRKLYFGANVMIRANSIQPAIGFPGGMKQRQQPS
jgi:hypothetical protein